jgi:hypothetical protein
VVAGMLHDGRTRSRVHPVYWWGGVGILSSGPLRFGLSKSQGWHDFAYWLIE